MRYHKRETIPDDGDAHFFREDEIHEAIDNLNDCFFPVKISVVTKKEYMDDTYGEGDWTQEDWDNNED
jgi:hypothetical protein